MTDAASTLAQCKKERGAMLRGLAIRPVYSETSTIGMKRPRSQSGERNPVSASTLVDRHPGKMERLLWTCIPDMHKPEPPEARNGSTIFIDDVIASTDPSPFGHSDLTAYDHAHWLKPSLPQHEKSAMTTPEVLPLYSLACELKRQANTHTNSEEMNDVDQASAASSLPLSQSDPSQLKTSKASGSSNVSWVPQAHEIRNALQVVPGSVARQQRRGAVSAAVREALTLMGQVITRTVVLSGKPSDNIVKEFCKEVGIDLWEDTTLHAFCHGLVANGISHENSCTFGKSALLPRFQGLTRPATRDLVNAAIEIAAVQPRAVVMAVLVPALGAEPSGACVELSLRVAKTLSADIILFMLSQLMANTSTGLKEKRDDAKRNETPGSIALQASDNTFGLLKSLLLKKDLVLSSECIINLTEWFHMHTDNFAQNVKFASAIHTMLTRHKANPSLIKRIDRFEQIVRGLDSFVKKSSLAAIRKIRQKNVRATENS